MRTIHAQLNAFISCSVIILLLLSWYIDECLMKAGSVLRKRCCLHVGGKNTQHLKLKKHEEKSRGVPVRNRFIFFGSRVWGEVAVAIPDATPPFLFFGKRSAVFSVKGCVMIIKPKGCLEFYTPLVGEI